jgi:hypothetical protein
MAAAAAVTGHLTDIRKWPPAGKTAPAEPVLTQGDTR